MSIQTIIKKAIKRIELEGNTLTPDTYSEAFCKEASRAGRLVEDCQGVDKYISMLNKDFQKEINEYRLKTTAELIRFLISRLNSTKSKYNDQEITKITNLLITSLSPSIAPKDTQEIVKITSKLNTKPTLIERENIKKEIKTAIAFRIALDKKSVKDMVKLLDGVVDKISLRLIKMIEISDTSNEDIQKIKNELENYGKKIEDNNFKEAHNRLYKIVVSLEENTRILSKDLKAHSSEITQLNAKIKYLENELE